MPQEILIKRDTYSYTRLFLFFQGGKSSFERDRYGDSDVHIMRNYTTSKSEKGFKPPTTSCLAASELTNIFCYKNYSATYRVSQIKTYIYKRKKNKLYSSESHGI